MICSESHLQELGPPGLLKVDFSEPQRQVQPWRHVGLRFSMSEYACHVWTATMPSKHTTKNTMEPTAHFSNTQGNTISNFQIYYTILYYTILYYTILYYTILYYAMLCYAMLCYAMLCYAMLCYAMLCYAMLCYAMLCYAMLCYAMLCYAMLCYAMLCYAMLCYAMLCYAMLCYATLRYATLRYATLRYAMLCYAMLCYAMLCYAMLCYAMLCYAMRCYAILTSSCKSKRLGVGELSKGPRSPHEGCSSFGCSKSSPTLLGCSDSWLSGPIRDHSGTWYRVYMGI